MSDTPRLGLPCLAAAQAQKHVTHNDALMLLDSLVQAGVKSRALATPPTAPAQGDSFLVAATATGAWSTREGLFAAFMDGDWRFIAPREGWRLWVDDEDLLIAFDGTAWQKAAADPAFLQNLALLGVNASADATNRLSVASPATLLTHEGAGHQLKINKAAAGDTASLLFQTNYSARAEMGTTGNDDFHVKVSPDGSSFQEALTIDATTAAVTARQSLRLLPRGADPSSPQDGELWYSSAGNSFRKRQNGVTTDLLPDAPALANATAALSADVQLVTSNSFYDGPTLTLAAGTWLVSGFAQFQKTTSTASFVTARLSTGTVHYASQCLYHGSVANITLGFAMTAVVTLSGATTVKLQMATTVGIANCLMKAAAPNNASGNTATVISAIRIQ